MPIVPGIHSLPKRSDSRPAMGIFARRHCGNRVHHDTIPTTAARPLVALVHLSDLLCRLLDLGYGYYEAMGVDLAGDHAWSALVQHYPELGKMDLARLTMDIDGAMEEITAVVDAVFKPQRVGTP